jgi:ATP-dependent Clp protease ATP-binding subunit ClpA/ATP-dependent Clp protease ATP-binding subunit ClpC
MDKWINKSSCDILKVAENEMLECHHPYVGTEHLLLSLLKNNNISNICYKFNLTYQDFKDNLLRIVGSAKKKSEVILYTPLLKMVIDKAYNKAYDDHKDLDEFYLLSALLSEQDGIALRVAGNMGVDIDGLTKEVNKPRQIYELGISLNDKVNDGVFLRDKEIKEIMQILLRKNKNNPLLIGHSGVGKTAVVEELAKRIKAGLVPEKLKSYEIILINTSTLIAGTKYRGEFESRVNNLINEVIASGNIILFIDEIHTIVKTGASDGSIDAANILKPYLARGDIKVIGATTTQEYNEYIKKDPALVRRFTPVVINEPSLNDTLFILNKLKKSYESYYNLKIDKKILEYLVDMTSKYLPHLYNPDKSIEILDTVCSKKLLDNKEKYITKEDVYEVIMDRINMKMISNDSLKLVFNELKDDYNEQVLKSVINVIRDRKLNKYMILNGDNKGKVKLIKTLAKKLKINLIMIDCIEYSDEYSINKLLNNNYLYNLLEEYPYSFICFENYDESNKVLYNLINTMISKGYVSNNSNEKLYINNSVIFILNNKEEKIGFNNHLLFAE